MSNLSLWELSRERHGLNARGIYSRRRGYARRNITRASPGVADPLAKRLKPLEFQGFEAVGRGSSGVGGSKPTRSAPIRGCELLLYIYRVSANREAVEKLMQPQPKP